MAEWTSEQKQAISYRDGNLLVSAAAGSGKTAVLIERIVNRILDDKDPVSVDELVVVTFTKAAAAEMKVRLSAAFEKMIEANPGNSYLMRQLALVDTARISTIDSFCQYIVRNYYNSIGIDPAFRLAEGGELMLIKNDVLSELLETKFAEQDPDFMRLTGGYASGKNIDKIYELVFELYDFANSNPWPEDWYEMCLDIYDADSVEEYKKLEIVTNVCNYAKECIRYSVDDYSRMIEMCIGADGFDKYLEHFIEEKERLSKLLDFDSIDDFVNGINFEFGRLPAARNVDVGLKESIQQIYGALKDRVKKIQSSFMKDFDSQFKELQMCKPVAKALIKLVMEFDKRLRDYMTSANIMSFSDIAHAALDILVKRTDSGVEYTRVADEIANQYREIYIDEYQDSNYVQEEIIKAVSTERFGKPDIFMVGDIKQSIYRFRMAKPEIFMQKYNTYNDEAPYRKIELHMNFRSRKNVLDCINDIFFMCMHESVGNVEYNEDVALNVKPGEESVLEDATRIILADNKEFDDINEHDLQAHMVACEIERLMKADKSISYRDIVILMRSVSDNAIRYSKILENHAIPCIYEKSTGYFSAKEIVKVLDFLNVIDNCRQEIPLAGLMRSSFSYFTAEEMALIKGRTRKTHFYDCIVNRAAKTDELGVKCKNLLDMIEKYRGLSKIMSVSELVTDIIYNTGYYDYVGTLDGGAAKKANLDMLISYAKEYEKTCYSGLFNFIRYIEKLKKYSADMGESQLASEEDDVVRIMSIHKSKGLEFPYVILVEAAKRFNLKDSSKDIIHHDRYGIALRPIDVEKRIKYSATYRDMLALQIKTDSVGEELRLLYVAMTRAVNRLIIVGSANLGEKNSMWESASQGEVLDMNYILENNTYLDYIMPAVKSIASDGKFETEVISAEDMKTYISTSLLSRRECFMDKLKSFDSSQVNDEDYDKVCKRLLFTYPHSALSVLRNKVSVSDLKHQSMEELEEENQRLETPEQQKYIPAFMRDTEDMVHHGINRGNAYHKVFELLDYTDAATGADVMKQLTRWVEEGRISAEYAGYIRKNRFDEFVKSDLGIRMRAAALRSELFREKTFLMQVDAREVNPEILEKESVLIQGIIDAFFFEEGRVYIVDYKTDTVDMGTGEECLVNRYATQLRLYADAICKITGCEVGGCYLYSVCLNRKIEIDIAYNG